MMNTKQRIARYVEMLLDQIVDNIQSDQNIVCKIEGQDIFFSKKGKFTLKVSSKGYSYFLSLLLHSEGLNFRCNIIIDDGVYSSIDYIKVLEVFKLSAKIDEGLEKKLIGFCYGQYLNSSNKPMIDS